MLESRPIALIVTMDNVWADTCEQAFAEHGYAVERAESGRDALALLRRRAYDYIAVDDSLPDFDPIEFGLNVRETTANEPELLVGLHRLSALNRIAKPCNIVYIGTRESLLTAISSLRNGA